MATRDDPDDHSGEAWPEREGRVEGVLGALRAVGLLDADEAESWRLRLTGPGVERPAPSDKTRQAAGELLQELLEAVPAEDEGRGDDFMRFQGALGALQAVGAASGEWYDRRARRMGWPTAAEVEELNAGGTEKDLRAVLAGPGRGGRWRAGAVRAALRRRRDRAAAARQPRGPASRMIPSISSSSTMSGRATCRQAGAAEPGK